jgi:hypothetical protein
MGAAQTWDLPACLNVLVGGRGQLDAPNRLAKVLPLDLIWHHPNKKEDPRKALS